MTKNAENTIETHIVETTAPDNSVFFCDELKAFFDYSGYDEEDFTDSEQLITVESQGQSCIVSLYELSDNDWILKNKSNGIVGKDGVSVNSSENNCHTPKGCFELGFAFGMENIDNLSIEYRQINENCYWIDDPESELYNQWIESDEITWNSAEHLIEYTESYKYAVSINCNMNPVVLYMGSAIFLHCDNGQYDYTAGCVAVPEEEMINILRWLDKSKNPKIMII